MVQAHPRKQALQKIMQTTVPTRQHELYLTNHEDICPEGPRSWSIPVDGLSDRCVKRWSEKRKQHLYTKAGGPHR